MSREQSEEALRRLAATCGIQCSYLDIWGNVHAVPLDVLARMLEAIGLESDHPEEALRSLEKRSWGQLTEPVLVRSTAALGGELHFQVPLEAEPDSSRPEVRLEISGENGYHCSHSYRPEELDFKGGKTIDGSLYGRWSLPFPTELGPGHYRFELLVLQGKKRQQAEISVFVCPERAHLPAVLAGEGRRAGIAVCLYGLRSSSNWGIGDFGDLKRLVRWAIETLHVDVVGLNPLHAISNRRPYNISPYYPSSRFYRNFIYLDIEAMPDYRASPPAKKLVEAESTQKLLAELRSSSLVDYERVAALKLRVLEVVFQSFLQRHWYSGAQSQRRGEFEEYMAREGAMLENFATFSALEAYFLGKQLWTWQQWPEPFQEPYSREVQEFRRHHSERILFYKYLQWQLERQLQEVQDLALSLGASVGLYHDLALGVDPGGADSWAYRDFFVRGVMVGAPPDDFAPQGQQWGFCPPDREQYRRDGYRLFVREIEKNSQPGGALRIDHIMRFFRLFWILEDQPPKSGTYVEYPYRELLNILALESQRSETLIIGEDLGTVPPEARRVLQGFGIFSYRLFYFEREENGEFRPPLSYPELALASISTHDLPTLAAFWEAEDIHLRNRLGRFSSSEEFQAALERRQEEKRLVISTLAASGFLSAEEAAAPQIYQEITAELHNAVVGFLVSTPAKLVILSLEDLWKDKRQQNLPGTVSEYPNWAIKMLYSLEDLEQAPGVKDYARMFRHWIDRAGRAVPAVANLDL